MITGQLPLILKILKIRAVFKFRKVEVSSFWMRFQRGNCLIFLIKNIVINIA